MTINMKKENVKIARSVSFSSRVAVVLIPERKEIIEAQCDLWWERSDYLAFQQSAHGEIRMYSQYQNVNCKEAKQRLYQPNSDDDIIYDPTYEPEEELDMRTRTESELEQEEIEKSRMPSPPAPIIKHVDSVTLLSALNENNSEEKPAVNSVNFMRAKDSLANLSSYHAPHSPVSVAARAAPSAESDPYYYVSLCVLSQTYDDLCVETTEGDDDSVLASPGRSSPVPSHRNSQGSPSPMKPSGSRRGGSQGQGGSLDKNSSLAVVFGIASFALPIIGLYLMNTNSTSSI